MTDQKLSANLSKPFSIYVFSSFLSENDTRDLSPQRVNAPTLSQVMSNWNVNITLPIQNLVPHSDSVSMVKLAFTSIDDFSPENAPLVEEISDIINKIESFIK